MTAPRNANEFWWDRYNALWAEYQYRHDLIWRVLFQTTAAGVVLTVAPYAINEKTLHKLGGWTLAAPGLAVLLTLFATIVLFNELKTFWRIKSEYREQQEQEPIRIPREETRPGFLHFERLKFPGFEVLVEIYLVSLLTLGVANFFFAVRYVL